MNESHTIDPKGFGAGRGALCLIFAAFIAAVTFVHFSGGIFCSVERSKGANVDHALGLAFVAGLAGPLLLLFARKHRRLCTAVLLTGAAALGIAIVLVSLDAATYAEHQSCGLMTSTETDINERVYYLYVLWGLPFAVLLRTALSNTSASPLARRAGTIVPFALIATLALATWAPAKSGARPSTLPAGTKVFAEPDHDHVNRKVRYDRNPPAGGPHNGVWLNCGVYAQPVRNENAVHSLEHGSVWITYSPKLPRSTVAGLRRFVKAHYRGHERYLILSPYPGLRRPVVASAWGAQLKLGRASDPRLAKFVDHFAGGGQGGEPGGYCTCGTGSPVG